MSKSAKVASTYAPGSMVILATLVALAGCVDRSATDPAIAVPARANSMITACAPLAVSAISASTDDGNVAANAIDGDFATRWSGFGIGAYITADLGLELTVCGVQVAWYQGNTRQHSFVVSLSSDGVTFEPVFTGTGSGTTTDFESYSFAPLSARYIRVTVNGNTVNEWASITELQVVGQGSTATYDQTVLTDGPVGFWAVNPIDITEPDLTGRGNTGTYQGGAPTVATMPNGDSAADFNGSNQYLTVPSDTSFSIPTTGNLTWEAWIRPSVLEFPNSKQPDGYVNFMGKCDSYAPTCEWSARMYNSTPSDIRRCNRLSAYVFNPSAGLGSGAFWQPTCGLIQAGQWLHVVAEYTTLSQPAICANTETYPGSIDIWVNGVKWNQSLRGTTGCMSQFGVVPQANSSPINIGTMAKDFWFQGAIGKVAIYNYLLSQDQITSHFTAMTGRLPTGICLATCSF